MGLLGGGMIRRIAQFLAVCAMAALSLMYLFQEGYASVFTTYWRETLFAGVGMISGWLFAVTHGLRPVVAIFAAGAFFAIAMMEEPSTASLLAALDGIGAKVLAVKDSFNLG